MAKCVAVFLKKILNSLTLDDPFLVKKSQDVIQVLETHKNKGLMACSFDVKDLYYSLPHDELFLCIEECIEKHDVVAFQNEAGISVSGFLELLEVYLNSTFAIWDGVLYLQKKGVCIGSCIAPVLSDLLLAQKDRRLQRQLEGSKALRCFRFVDDFFVLLDTDVHNFEPVKQEIQDIFVQYLHPFTLTSEVPENNTIRFLDLRLSFTPNHTCWSFEPRSNKPLLPFASSHSKLVKRAVAKSCYYNALNKSCIHAQQDSFNQQTDRLVKAGYPKQLLVSVSESMLASLSKNNKNDLTESAKEKEKTTVVPYIHKFSHKLKKIGNRAQVRVVFSAPEKLGKLCKRVNDEFTPKKCSIKHENKFVACQEGVIYSIPLSCGKQYVGQTGRCVNERLREHNITVYNTVKGHLGIHCRDCESKTCQPFFQQTKVLSRHPNTLTREIIEAAEIARLNDACISCPSISLSKKELEFLSARK